MTAPQELRTSRLLLRSLHTDDIPALVRLAGAREVAAMTTRIPHPYTERDARSFLAQGQEEFRAGTSVLFAIATPPESAGGLPEGTEGQPPRPAQRGELCGTIVLRIVPADQHAELGYWIGVPYWGRGYATEAGASVLAFGFHTLRLNRIFAHYFAGNTASRRVLEKIGMRSEGRFPGHVFKAGRFIDIENYGLLAADFRGGK